MVKRKLTVGGLICHLASVVRFHWKDKNEAVTHHFLSLTSIPHAISFWNMIPGSLLPHFNCDQNALPKEREPVHLHFPNKTN